MNEDIRNVYIACSMIKAKQLDFSLLDFLIDYVREQEYNPFVPGKMEDATPKAIFERDLNWLKQVKIIIADVNEPSHGVGMEIMYAFEHDIPVLCLLNESNKPLSRMVEGSPHVHLIIYKNKEDLSWQLAEIDLELLDILECRECQEKTIHIHNQCLKC